MPTLVRHKSNLRRKNSRKRAARVRTPAKLDLSREEAALVNAIARAAAHSLGHAA